MMLFTTEYKLKMFIASYISMGRLYTKMAAINRCRTCAMRAYDITKNHSTVYSLLLVSSSQFTGSSRLLLSLKLFSLQHLPTASITQLNKLTSQLLILIKNNIGIMYSPVPRALFPAFQCCLLSLVSCKLVT